MRTSLGVVEREKGKIKVIDRGHTLELTGAAVGVCDERGTGMRMIRETTLAASQDIQGATATGIVGTKAVKKIKMIGHAKESR